VVDLTAVLGPTESGLQLVQGRVECGIEVLGTRFASHHRALAHCGDLEALTDLRLSTVLLVVELDIESEDRRVEAFDARELVHHVDAEVFGDFDVPAADLHFGVRAGQFV
jgi:hypothetical protein